MHLTQDERRSRAIAAAQAVAERYGVAVEQQAILHDSNHTVIHLAPAPLVAKVNTSPEVSDLSREVRLASFLAERTAAVVAPTSLFPPGPHIEQGLEVTFWEYCAHQRGELDPLIMGQAMRVLHEALLSFAEPLPPWDEFDGLERVLCDPAGLRALSPEDRAFLRDTYRDLRDQIDRYDYAPRPLHGEPHAGNLLLSEDGPRWIDFESACRGPAEWDLTMLLDDVVRRYFQGVDHDLLRILRRMRSLCVATWCWVDPDRDPILREAGTYHLSRLRGSS